MSDFPQRIICLTEEAVEFLYSVGESHRIIGVSAYAQRPPQVKEKEVVCAFTGGNSKKIASLNPDLVIGYSDIQKDLARDLIGLGLNVYISNHRSIGEILNYLKMLGRIVNRVDETNLLIENLEDKLASARSYAKTLLVKPNVYLEEWDEPRICAIEWFAQIVELCGAQVIFVDKSKSKMAKDRIVEIKDFKDKEIDIIFGCWCGKKVDTASIGNRLELKQTAAVKTGQIFELDPAIFLQPGIAPILSGIDQIIAIFKEWSRMNTKSIR